MSNKKKCRIIIVKGTQKSIIIEADEKHNHLLMSTHWDSSDINVIAKSEDSEDPFNHETPLLSVEVDGKILKMQNFKFRKNRLIGYEDY